MKQIVICPKCQSGTLEPCWLNRNELVCINCSHTVKTGVRIP
jgi:hypothetical protein